MSLERVNKMGKNLIPIIAKELGVEIGEKFYVSGENFLFKFVHEDLFLFDEDDEEWYGADNETLIDLVRGEQEIIKLPFKPTCGERYYTFTDDWDITWVDCEDTFFDFMCKELNVAYRSAEDAYKARPAKYKELTGEEWGYDDGNQESS
jgi:hypothetical protein